MTSWPTPSQPDHPSFLEHEVLLTKVLELGFIDYPTGWAIQCAGLRHSSEKCSAVQSLAFLCDCGALESRWLALRQEAGAS